MLAAAAAATLWLAARRFAVPVGAGSVVVGAFYGAPPLTAYATQVYPEMPAALCVALGLAAITGPLRCTGRALALVSIVALPWLSVKFVPVAAVIAVVLSIRLWPDRRRQLALDLLILAVAATAYVVFHRNVYGGWTACWWTEDSAWLPGRPHTCWPSRPSRCWLGGVQRAGGT